MNNEDIKKLADKWAKELNWAIAEVDYLDAEANSFLESEIKKLLPQWRPIETAPKNGDRILTIDMSQPLFWRTIVEWIDGWITDRDDYIDGMTHWMPLPQPPEIDE